MQDLKRYGWKDGIGVKPMKPRQTSATRKPAEQPDISRQQTKAAPAVEIPANFRDLSAKELMKLLDALGVRRDDCFEKIDLVKRVEEHQQKMGGGPSFTNQKSQSF